MGLITDEEVKRLYEKFDLWKKNTLVDGRHVSIYELKVMRQYACDGSWYAVADIGRELMGLSATVDDQLYDECCREANANRDSISFEQFEEVVKVYHEGPQWNKDKSNNE